MQTRALQNPLYKHPSCNPLYANNHPLRHRTALKPPPRREALRHKKNKLLKIFTVWLFFILLQHFFRNSGKADIL